MLPDLDAVPGILVGDIGRFHNQATHSLLVGVAVALAAAIPLAHWRRAPFLRLWLLLLLPYEAHVLMDFCTPGRGVMLLWPVSAERFSSPVSLFEGFHWGNGLLSPSHLWTIASETLLVAPLVLLTELAARRRAAGERLFRAPAGRVRSSRGQVGS